ncbi:MAG: substrate-binding domain-containing protein [Treponema sp.]|nr:substrate-binding domain-containing protein [Treponema sp.]
MLVLFICAFSFLACGKAARTGDIADAAARKGTAARVLLEQFMPEAMKDGLVKIAVLDNQKKGDNSRQFIEGCVSEGRSMGFTVDAFVSGADENRCREIADGIARADYDGLIFAHGRVDFSYDILKPIADKGIHIVTFETLPYRDGKSINGLITTFQDDYHLARLSLETLISLCGGEERPPRVLRIGCDPGILFLDRRAWEFDKMANEGKITEAAFIKLDGLGNPHGAAWAAVAAILHRFPRQSVDALWVPWDEFAGGCAEALARAGRQDIKMVSIGVSNDDIRLMQLHAPVWLANAAVDPKIVGTVTMRILSARLAGEKLHDTFSFDPQLLKTGDLNHAVTAANLSVMLPDWGEGNGVFDRYQWMIDLKAAVGKSLRIPAAAAQ